jgi:exodeoxyribonuclease VII large subunit
MEQMYAVIDTMRERLASAYEKALKQRSETLSSLELRLQAVSPDINILNSTATLKGLEERLNRAAADIVSKKSAQLEKYSASLNALSPYKVLERGYTITLKNGAAVSSFEQLDKNDEITVRFKDFAVTAKITDITRLIDI